MGPQGIPVDIRTPGEHLCGWAIKVEVDSVGDYPHAEFGFKITFGLIARKSKGQWIRYKEVTWQYFPICHTPEVPVPIPPICAPAKPSDLITFVVSPETDTFVTFGSKELIRKDQIVED